MKGFLLGDQYNELELTAARLVVERIRQRTGHSPLIIFDQEKDGSWIVAGTPGTSSPIAEVVRSGAVTLPLSLGVEGFVIHEHEGTLYVAALHPQGVFYGLGQLLHSSSFANGSWIPSKNAKVISIPDKPIRGIYFATHFGNWYCHADLEEIKTYLEDLALWGINELVTWFDCSHYHSFEEGAALWERLGRLDGFASALGLKVGRITVSNEGFRGQAGQGRVMLSPNAYAEVDPHPLRAKDRIYGGFDTDICPSEPDGLALIMQNKREVFSKMPKLDSVWFWPYDSGGCNCPQCTPWPKTFLNLNRELTGMLREFNPRIQTHASTWWMGYHVKEENEALFEALGEHEDWLHCILAGSEQLLGWTKEGRSFPPGHTIVLFPEISMFDTLPWGGLGSNAAPRKFTEEFASLAHVIGGAIPYSEGIYEDFNKVLWAQLLWRGGDTSASASDITREYCQYYFGANHGKLAAGLLAETESLVCDNKNTEEAPGLYKRAVELENQLEEWAKAGWRWKIIMARLTMLDGIEHLKAAHTDRDEIISRMKTVFDRLQHDIYRHIAGKSLDIWIYSPFEIVFEMLQNKQTS